jgi:hypothetical protein
MYENENRSETLSIQRDKQGAYYHKYKHHSNSQNYEYLKLSTNVKI